MSGKTGGVSWPGVPASSRNRRQHWDRRLSVFCRILLASRPGRRRRKQIENPLLRRETQYNLFYCWMRFWSFFHIWDQTYIPVRHSNWSKVQVKHGVESFRNSLGQSESDGDQNSIPAIHHYWECHHHNHHHQPLPLTYWSERLWVQAGSLPSSLLLCSWAGPQVWPGSRRGWGGKSERPDQRAESWSSSPPAWSEKSTQWSSLQENAFIKSLSVLIVKNHHWWN